MSRYQTVYCGPYARFQYPRKMQLEEVKECTGCKISADYESKSFCGNCGMKFSLVSQEVEEDPNVYETLGETEELRDLYQNTDDRVLCVGPNIQGFGRCIEEDESPLDIEGIDIAEEKSRFSTRFRDDLAKLSAEYGEATIHWGVLTWAS